MRRLGTITLAFFLLAPGVVIAQADNQAFRSQAWAAAQDLQDWLSRSDQAEAWRKYLSLNRLITTLSADEPSVDTEAVIETYVRLQGDAPGLNLRHFQSLSQHLADLLRAENVPSVRILARIAAADQISFQPIDQSLLNRARNRLEQSIAALQQFLSGADQARETAWKDYLMWETLTQQLAAKQPDPQILGQVATRYYAGHRGLQLPRFAEVGEDLVVWRRLILAKGDTQVSQLVRQQLQRLASDLQDADVAQRGSNANLAARLVWLEQLGQAENLVKRIRQLYDQPNLYLYASSEVVSEGMEETVDSVVPVNEQILKTRVTGTAHTTGTVTGILIPNDSIATVSIQLSGNTTSDTVGYQRPVRIYSQSATELLSSKSVFIGSQGISSAPACTSATTHTNICRIVPQTHVASNLIRKVAWKRAAQQKSAAERESARLASRRASSMMDERVDSLLAEANDRLRSELREPLQQRGIYPRDVRSRSSQDRLYVTAWQANERQLAASRKPPQEPEQDMALQIHESFVHNTALSAVGGLTLTDVNARDLVEELTGEIPEELELRQDDDPWSISFDRLQPVTVNFYDDRITIALRGRRFTRGDQVVSQTIEIAATYRMDILKGHAKLVREDDIEVTYPAKDSKRLSLTELRNKTFMQNKFEALFKPVIEGEGLTMPKRFKQLESLALAYVSSQNGWLTLGWE